jgi:peptide/nickel transport system substrate-binding protein
MPEKRFYSLIVCFSIVAIVLAACAPAAPTATQAPAPTQEATEAPAPTEEPAATEPAATEPAAPGVCPAITVADMQGVAAGQWPQQYEVAEFEAAAGCEMTFTGRDNYDERLVQYKFLPEGDLPPLEERLPEEPLVVVPYDAIGKYGGRISGASIGPESGNSEWLSVRHVNLLRFTDDLQTIVPNMAKAYEWNSDYTELTITLRKGHKWSDGEPFTSDDIVFWWEDIVMNKDLYPDVPSFWVYGGEPMQVEAVDDVTVKFKFAAPAPAFTTLLATTYTHEWAPKHYLQNLLPKYNPKADEEAKAAGFDSWTAQFKGRYDRTAVAIHRRS